MLTSFLVPVYNREEMLPRCLDSILAQSGELEVVVVDGASTDGTWEVCRQYARGDWRVKIHQQAPNTDNAPAIIRSLEGYVRCVDEAIGHYGKWVYSDDAISPHYLAETLPHLKPDVGFVWTRAGIGATPEDVSEHYAWAQLPMRIESGTYLRGALAGDPRVPVSPGCALFRMSDIRRNFLRRWPFISGTDLLLFMLTAADYPFVVAHPGRLAYFCAHPGSVSINSQAEVQRGYSIAREHFELIR